MNEAAFIIDDDEADRDSLVFLLRTEGITSRAFPSARAFLDQLHPHQTGCIITDMRMPGMDGLAFIEALAEIGCDMPIIAVTGHGDVPLAVRTLKAGVTDFIQKPFDTDTLVDAVRSGLELAQARRANTDLRAMINQRRKTLTERERQVLGLLVDGLSNKEMSAELGISSRTVEIFRANVMSKMRAESLSELIRMALLTGDTPPPSRRSLAS